MVNQQEKKRILSSSCPSSCPLLKSNIHNSILSLPPLFCLFYWIFTTQFTWRIGLDFIDFFSLTVHQINKNKCWERKYHPYNYIYRYSRFYHQTVIKFIPKFSNFQKFSGKDFNFFFLQGNVFLFSDFNKNL